MKIRFECKYCGSNDLRFDAYAEWNEETQDYELSAVFPGGTICEQCEGPTSVNEIKIN